MLILQLWSNESIMKTALKQIPLGRYNRILIVVDNIFGYYYPHQMLSIRDSIACQYYDMHRRVFPKGSLS